MQYLAIDTTTQEIKLATYNTENKQTFQLIEFIGRKQSEQLHVKIKELLKQAKVKIKDLNMIIVNLGPGSYTSLRLGIATAKGLALPHNINVIGVNSFDLIQDLYLKDANNEAIILENTESQVYLQANSKKMVIAPEELKDNLNAGQNIYGSGISMYKDFLQEYNLIENSGKIDPIEIINYAIKHNLIETHLDPLYLKPLTYKKYEYKL